MAISEVMSKAKQMTEVERLSAKLAEAKRNVSRIERAIEVAKRKEKEAQQTQRAKKIKALLEANKGKRVLVEWSVYNDESDMYSSALAEAIELKYQNGGWVISSIANHWAGTLEIVANIFIQAEI